MGEENARRWLDQYRKWKVAGEPKAEEQPQEYSKEAEQIELTVDVVTEARDRAIGEKSERSRLRF
jgi:hypothetical protein